LLLGIELFNKPSDTARVEGVLLLLDHSFEMLLKAVVFAKTGKIKSAGDKFNYAFEKCLNICQSQLTLVDADQALVLKNLNGFRDAAMHDLVDISEGLLYSHAQSAIQIYAVILKKAFSQNLSDVLPRRILPISAGMPTDIGMIVGDDMASAKSLLSGKKRREEEAEAKLRPYEIIERNIREVQGVTGEQFSLQTIVKRLKSGEWKQALPLVTGLVQPSSGGIPLSLHVTKKEGCPVRIDPSAATAIAFRYIKPEDKYPYLTKELAEKLGISTNKVVGLVKLFQMRGNEQFHTSIKVSKTGLVQRYSEKAHQVLTKAIKTEGLEELWKHAKAGVTKNPTEYSENSA
jgi:hypothetical protein